MAVNNDKPSGSSESEKDSSNKMRRIKRKRMRGVWITAIATTIAAVVPASMVFAIEEQKLIQANNIRIEETHKREVEQQKREQEQKKNAIYRQMYQNAPEKFIHDLGALIKSSPDYRIFKPEDLPKRNESAIRERCRAIVAARNNLRSALDNIGARLDSQIDILEKELKQPHPHPAYLAETLEVLKQSWPSKESEIELSVRKMMAELGIVPDSTNPRGD
jgi:hypothetical protein